MKKTLLIIASVSVVAFVALTITSCAKDYTCKCSGGTTATIKAASKSAADKACKDLGSDCSIQ